MGSNSSSSGGGEGPANRYQKPPEPKKKNTIVEFIKGGGITGAIIRGIGQVSQGFKKAQQTYRTRKTNTSLLGTSDFQGDVDGRRSRVFTPTTSGGNGNGSNNNQNIKIPKVNLSPTTAEVSQATAANATEYSSETDDPILLTKRRIKARGRSSTILTGPTGVDETLTLGRRSLLGR